MRRHWVLIALLGILLFACTVIPTPTGETTSPDAFFTHIWETIEAGMTQTAEPPTGIETAVAGTVAAALTQSAVAPVDTPVPTGTITPTAAPEENAPDPLPATHTGIILNNGECFNFDNGQTLSAPDEACDVWLVEPALFRQVNAARLSGYVTLSPPSRTRCIEARYEAGDLAVQTDMYYCFITAEAQVGFIVVREYRGGIPSTGIVFDYWIFR